MRTLILILALALAAPQSPTPPPPKAEAAKPEAAPVLSELDRMKVINAAQAIELANLKLQAAAAEVTRVRGEADKLIAALQIPGWVLNEKLEYVRPAKPGGGGQ